MLAVFIFVRISDVLRTKNLISMAAQARILFFFTVWILVGAFFFTSALVTMTIFVAAPLILLIVCPLYLRRRRHYLLMQELPMFISTIILRMSVGDSLGAALKLAGQQVSDWSWIKISQVLEMVEVSSEHEAQCHAKADIFYSTMCEIVKIQKLSHQALPRLRILREKIEIEEQFRKKRARVTSLVRAQVAILTLLYIGLLGFIFVHEDVRQIQAYLTISVFLFAMGTLGLFWMGARFQWKV